MRVMPVARTARSFWWSARGERDAEQRLLVHDRTGRIVEDGLDALGARLFERLGFAGVHGGLENGTADAGLLGIARVVVGHVVALDHERRGFPADVPAEGGLDVLVLDLERLDPQEDIEVGIHGGGGALEIF
jgi:hypothetical protein